MNKTKKFFTFVLVAIFCFSMPLSVNAAGNTPNDTQTSRSSEITPYKDYTNWRYQVVDGKLYRRLYNYVTDEWVGEWELCP